MASKYYSYDNATRRLKIGKFTYVFDVVGQFAGAWKGVLELTNKDEIKALESEAKRLGVTELTKAEYEELKKKALQFKLASKQKSIRQVNQNMGSGLPAVTVASPGARMSSAGKKSPVSQQPSLKSVLKYADVTSPSGI